MEIFVRTGESFWYYSRLFQVPLSLITQSNSSISPSHLPIGQQVKIPGYTVLSYRVILHDTLWKIAALYQTSVDAIIRLNPWLNPSNMLIGQTIFVSNRITGLVVLEPSKYTYDKLIRDINRLTEIYPFIRKNIVGTSVLSKELIEIQMDSGQKQVHVNGAFHANEWITTPVIIRFLNHYALAITNNQPIRGLYMLP